jgi:hypothetical protein
MTVLATLYAALLLGLLAVSLVPARALAGLSPTWHAFWHVAIVLSAFGLAWSLGGDLPRRGPSS